MKEINVTVITNVELGWDCVVGVVQGYLEQEDFIDDEDPDCSEYQGDEYVFSHEILYLD